MFGKRLKSLRHKAGYSQEELAIKLNISASTIAMYETDKRDNPDISTLVAIADLFDCSVDYLLGRIPTPYLALLDDLPEEFRATGIETLQMTKNAIKEGLTPKMMAELLDFVKKINAIRPRLQ